MSLDPILVVDDEDEIRLHLKESLERDGFRVEDASNGLSALAMIESRHYPVVLTDLNMPGGPTGFELIQAVKARDPLALCVVLTGFASTETAIQALKYGAYDFVQKPFHMDEIVAVLNRALDHAGVLAQLKAYQQDLEARVMARVQDLKQFQEEVLHLNELLVASQDAPDLRTLLQPFLDHAARRFHPREQGVLFPERKGWKVLQPDGTRTAFSPGAPEPARLTQAQEWASAPGTREGWLIPLRKGETLMAALYLDFPWRAAFQPEDRTFRFWRGQVEAALYGWLRRRPRANASRSPRSPKA